MASEKSCLVNTPHSPRVWINRWKQWSLHNWFSTLRITPQSLPNKALHNQEPSTLCHLIPDFSHHMTHNMDIHFHTTLLQLIHDTLHQSTQFTSTILIPESTFPAATQIILAILTADMDVHTTTGLSFKSLSFQLTHTHQAVHCT